MQQRSTGKRRAIIIGCGIAGPAVAMFLQSAGFDATVYESQTGPADYAGLFLNTAANGLDVLKTLGIDEQVKAEGFAMKQMSFANGEGKPLGAVPNGTDEHHGWIIKRGLLQKLIREEAIRRGIRVEFGKALKEIKVTEEQQVIACFQDGSEERGDLLVGCDGIHSRTRQLTFPDAPKPSYTGAVGLGGITRRPDIAPTPGVQKMIFGKKAFFGYLVKQSGEIYWFSNIAMGGEPTRKELNMVPMEEWRRRLLALHAEDQPIIADLISSTAEIGVHPIHDIPCQPNWHKGPVVLVGDSAHATSPHAGQGASLALEDAIVLAKCLRDIPDVQQAFAAYERLRKERVEKVVEAARRIGQTKTATSPVARFFRDLMMPIALKLFVKPNMNAWLYSYKVNWEQRLTQ